jgi:hypothetical protein
MRHLPKWPEPLTEEEQRIIFESQTAILEWIASTGGKVEDDGQTVCGNVAQRKTYGLGEDGLRRQQGG